MTQRQAEKMPYDKVAAAAAAVPVLGKDKQGQDVVAYFSAPDEAMDADNVASLTPSSAAITVIFPSSAGSPPIRPSASISPASVFVESTSASAISRSASCSVRGMRGTVPCFVIMAPAYRRTTRFSRMYSPGGPKLRIDRGCGTGRRPGYEPTKPATVRANPHTTTSTATPAAIAAPSCTQPRLLASDYNAQT